MTPASCTTRCPPLPARYDDTLTAMACRCGPKPRVTAVAGGKVLMVHGPAGPERLPADLIHLHSPHAAHEFVAASGLDADGTDGFIAVDPATLPHRAFRRVWAV